MTLYVLPGLGAGSAMYRGSWQGLKDAEFLDWPEYKGEEKLSELAHRIVTEHKISKSDAVVGWSLGGIMALEILEHVDVSRVFLIAGAIASSEIRLLLNQMSPIARITPMTLCQVLAGDSFGEIKHLFAKSDPALVRAMCLAIADWPGKDISVEKVTRIHGQDDEVIRCPHECLKIQGGGHLVAITHARKCTDMILNDLGGAEVKVREPLDKLSKLPPVEPTEDPVEELSEEALVELTEPPEDQST